MSLYKCIVVYIAVIGVVTEAARILAVFPAASISHQVVFRPITQELARRGHQVVVITTDPAFPKGGCPDNLTEIDTHDVSYKAWHDHFIVKTSKGSKNDLRQQAINMANLHTILIEKHMGHEEIKKLIEDKTQTFDLLLLESFVRPALIYSFIYKAPVIQISTFGGMLGDFYTAGAPTHPVLYPGNTRQKLNNLTTWEKIVEIYNFYEVENRFLEEGPANNIFKKIFGSDVPPLSKLVENVDMLFLNVNPIFYGVRPVPPNVVYIGGVQKNEEKELPSDLKSYLDSSRDGVIYLSFGTNVEPSFLPAEKIQIFVRVLSQLPYNVLWKWNKDELPGRTDNIRISKWFPQSDLLRHPKIKLFITQGGLQSTDEAILAGVPLIGIPMLGDQWYNVEKYVENGIGVRLDMETLTDYALRKEIINVIEGDSYRRNVIRLRDLMADQPQSPLDRAVWWTEHVLRHGGARHLRAPAANMPWAQYFELELLLNLLAVLSAAVSVALISLYYIFTKLSSICKQDCSNKKIL